MISKKEQQKYQAQEDAYTMARYQEILQDKARVARAVKVAKEQATNIQQQASAMQKVANTKPARTSTTTKKKK